MDTLEAIEKRRSVKHFDPGHRMSEKEIETLLRHAILSPTSFNIQNWRVVHVTDPGLRQKIREAAWNQAQVTEASLLFILCADLKAWSRDPDRYWRTAPDPVRTFLVDSIRKFYSVSPQLERDEAMRSTGLMGQTIMLAAKAMGYDSCPMVGFDPDAVAKLIGLPEDHVISYMVVVGRALQEARPRGGQLALEEVVVKDHF